VHCSYWKTGYPLGLCCPFWASVFQRFKSAVCWTPTIDFFTRNTMSFQWLWIAYTLNCILQQHIIVCTFPQFCNFLFLLTWKHKIIKD
jgi:hypothetical protein